MSDFGDFGSGSRGGSGGGGGPSGGGSGGRNEPGGYAPSFGDPTDTHNRISPGEGRVEDLPRDPDRGSGQATDQADGSRQESQQDRLETDDSRQNRDFLYQHQEAKSLGAQELAQMNGAGELYEAFMKEAVTAFKGEVRGTTEPYLVAITVRMQGKVYDAIRLIVGESSGAKGLKFEYVEEILAGYLNLKSGKLGDLFQPGMKLEKIPPKNGKPARIRGFFQNEAQIRYFLEKVKAVEK